MNQDQYDFWSENPCGAEGSFSQIISHRYRMEPWIPSWLTKIAQKSGSYLEIGCGQGIDAYFLCSKLHPGSSYIAIDFSSKSVEIARNHHQEADQKLRLRTTPTFQQGNALNLPFPDNHFDVIYSLGVIHHTPKPHQAVSEAIRVCKPGGKIFIVLYRKFSVKVSVAKMLRGFQWFVDKIFQTNRIFYRLFKGHHKPAILGTMIIECFGVPYMHTYTKKEITKLLSALHITKIKQIGLNLPRWNSGNSGETALGYFWLCEAEKTPAQNK